MTDKRTPRDSQDDPIWNGARKPKDYEVGYGKPPKNTRFKKGQSGNPKGRPRKKEPNPLKFSDAPSERIFEEEIYRSVSLLDQGEQVSLPTIRAIMRSQTMAAIKGNRFAQKEVLERAERLELEKRDQKISRYFELKQYKERGENIIAECTRKGEPVPKLLPHPDDIVLNAVTADAYVNGPETEDDERFYEYAKLMRDFMLLLHVNAEKSKKGPKLEHEGEQLCAYAIFAHTMDLTLPKRFQWESRQYVTLIQKYQDLRKKERLVKISADRALIKETKPPNKFITPEIQSELDRVSKGWLSS